MAQKVSESVSEFHISVLLAMAVFGLVLSSVATTLGVAKLAYDYQLSLPPTTQVAAVADSDTTGLTSAQVAAVLNLLTAFNAPKDTIISVGAILTNSNSDNSDPGQSPMMTSSSVGSANTAQTIAGTMMSPPGSNSASGAASSTQGRPRPGIPMICPAIARHLNRGTTGDDVTSLQQFLAQQGVLNTDNVTGVFGSTTQMALQQWQLAKGIIVSTSPDSGAGEVGTLTRQAIMKICGGIRSMNTAGDASASSTPPMPPKLPAGTVPSTGAIQSGRQ